MFESISEAVTITDLDGRVVDANPAAVQLHGYGNKQELIGMKASDIVAEGDRERAIKDSINIFKTGKAKVAEYKVIVKSSTPIDGEFCTSVMRDQSGNATGFVGVLRDISERKRMEEALRASEEKLRVTFNSTRDGIVVVDLLGNVADFNDAVLRLTGYSRSDFVGKGALDFVYEEDRQIVVNDMANTVAAQKAILETLTLRMVRKDGRVFTGELACDAVRDKQGNVAGFVAVLRDVTEKLHLEEKVRESERKLRTIFESITDGLIVTDMSGKIVDANEAALLIGNRESIEDWKGHDGREFIVEEDKERLEKAVIRAIIGPKKQHSEFVEYRARHKDGTPFYGESSVAVLRDTEGKPTGIVFVTRDISERRRLEEKVRDSERKLRAVVSTISDGLIITDMMGKITDVNEAALHIGNRRDIKDWKGRDGREFLVDADRERITKIVVATIKDPTKLHSDFFEYTARNKDGTPFYGESSVAVMRDNDGKPTGIVFVTRDINERKRLELALNKANDDLKRSNKDLEQFVYIASHDLQEPLRMVSSYTQLLGKRYKGKLDSDADEFIGFAVDGAARMQNMINDLLTYSRVTTRGKEFEPVDLEKVFSDAADNLQIAIEENKATITHDPLPRIMADESQMVRLLQNLIANAIKFHGEELPVVHVGVKEGTEEWVISVKDNGIGIDKKYFDRLFAIFQRLHTREQYPGTGIGLAVCKRTVERHGGRIWVESEGEGKGSIFIFTIPKRELKKKIEPPKSGQGEEQ